MTVSVNSVLTSSSPVEQPDVPASQGISLTGTYTGTGVAQTPLSSLPGKPTLVVVKADSASYSAVFACSSNFIYRSDYFGATESTGGAITLTDTGFSVGTVGEVNANTVTYHYVVYIDNGANGLIDVSWHGNGVAGRTMDLLSGYDVAGAIIKRDSSQNCVFAIKDYGAYDHNGAGGTYATINDDGTITLDGSALVNQWTDPGLGEGTLGLGWINGSDVYAASYLGTGAARKVPLPWEPDFILVSPCGSTGASVQLWFSTLSAGQHVPAGTGAVSTGRFTEVGKSYITLSTADQVNKSGVRFFLFAIRKQRASSDYRPPRRAPVYTKAIQLASGGYIDCGTSDTLKFDGAHTLEFFGALYPPSTTIFSAGSGADTEANKQNPIFCRTAGADNTAGNTSFALVAACQRAGGSGMRGGDWSGASLQWATYPKWAMPITPLASMDPYPANSGVLITPGALHHIMLSHDGSGGWVLMIDGVARKERKRDMVSAISQPNIQGGTGHKTVFGARWTTAFEDAYGMQFRMARVYARCLTITEMQANWAAIFGEATATPGWLEMWDAADATGSTLPATVSAANNGTITSGIIEGV